MQKTWFKKVTLGAFVHIYLIIFTYIHILTHHACIKFCEKMQNPNSWVSKGTTTQYWIDTNIYKSQKKTQNVDGSLEKKCQKFYYLWRFLDFWRHSHLRRCGVCFLFSFLFDGESRKKRAVKSGVFVFFEPLQCSIFLEKWWTSGLFLGPQFV